MKPNVVFYSVISAGWLFTHIAHLNACLECIYTHPAVFLLCIMCEVYFPFNILYLMVPGIWTHWSFDVGGQPWIRVNSAGTVSLLIEITWHTFILNEATCTKTSQTQKYQDCIRATSVLLPPCFLCCCSSRAPLLFMCKQGGEGLLSGS